MYITISHHLWYLCLQLATTWTARSSDFSSGLPLCWSSPRPMGERRCLWRVNVGSMAATNDTPRHNFLGCFFFWGVKFTVYKTIRVSLWDVFFERCSQNPSALTKKTRRKSEDALNIRVLWYLNFSQNVSLLMFGRSKSDLEIVPQDSNTVLHGWYSVKFSWGMWKQHGQGAQWLHADTFVLKPIRLVCACVFKETSWVHDFCIFWHGI